uniref:Armadillo/beta-catenin-like repeat protein n=1 Tax=Heterorhabditis bacteriophora TaxID=37862 RepID=A0A1I7XVD7_HETBA
MQKQHTIQMSRVFPCTREVPSTDSGRRALPASPVQGSKCYQRVLPHPQYREGMADSCGSPLNVQTGSGMNPAFKVHMWQNLNFDSGVHTMAHSQAPSMISMTSIHAGSQISTMSSVADGDRTELTDQQQQKFDNISVSICASQAEYGIAARAIPELLQLMKDTDEAVVYKALYIVQNIAKMDSENQRSRKAVIDGPSVVVALNDVLKERSAFPVGMRKTRKNIIRVALGALFHICNRAEGLEHVTSVNALCNGQMIRLLVQHVRSNVQFSCYKYALLTLHSLLSDRNRGSMSVDVARKINAMQVVSGWLDHEKSEKLLPVIVDLIRILCDKNTEQKNPLSLVSNGAPTALAHHLTHASERLVLASLECLRNLSDVHSEANYSELLRGLLQLFGHRSLKVVRYTLDILSNMCANNKGNKQKVLKYPNSFFKEFLIANNAIPYLLRVLNEVRVGPHMDAVHAQQIEEIHERILATLCHLCLGHSMASEVQHAIFRMPELFLEKLIDMRPVILRQTLQVLSKAAVQDENLTAFRDLRLEHTCFAQQIIYILRVACNQLATTQWVEDVKVSDLIQFSLLTLQLLCRDKGILNMVVYFLLHADSMKVNDECVLLPIFVLQQGYVDEESLKRCALGLIAAILQHPEVHNL